MSPTLSFVMPYLLSGLQLHLSTLDLMVTDFVT